MNLTLACMFRNRDFLRELMRKHFTNTREELQSLRIAIGRAGVTSQSGYG